MQNTGAQKSVLEICYHCGEDCDSGDIHIEEKKFCCQGCKMVYEIINQNGLCEYYDIEKAPGISQKMPVREGKFAFLDNAEIAGKLIHFKEGNKAHIPFYLPQMHCSSCIWLLEHLNSLNRGVLSSVVNFLKREVTVIFNTDQISLKKLAELLTRVGYEPHISMKDMDNKNLKKYDRKRIYKIGVAGFCFGNIMLLSFPEYFSSGDIEETHLKYIFSYLNLGLSLPVFFYCASEFFTSAYKSLKQNFLNIDAPIALAILITFGRSVIEILTQTGAGYLDSMSGIVFFMLIGRFFQDRTYQSLSFDRDYTSYFPIGVTRLNTDGEEHIPVSEIKKGDRLKIHSHEIIPADGILFLGKANIDYSFVTGESLPSEKGIGELVYAGGKQVGAAIEMEVVKEVSQSYLTQLWNNDVFKKTEPEKRVSFVHRISRYFTYILFSIAILAAVYWSINDSSKVWHAVTSVLIVACPCALLLSATFTNGNMLSKLKNARFFVKNANVLEGLSEIDTIVFDKTGTISLQSEATIKFEEGALTEYEQQLVRTLAIQSNHPLSKAVAAALPRQKQLKIRGFNEAKGKGCMAFVNEEFVKIGSKEFVSGIASFDAVDGSRVYVSVNSELLGFFRIKTAYRKGLEHLIKDLEKNYKLAVISGDNDSERQNLRKMFGAADLHFGQSPQDKLDYIKRLQTSGKKVLMIGDGLNDAGALQQSNVGIVVSDDINNFSPGCDAILDGRQFSKLKNLIDYCRKEKSIIYGSFVISILYNIVGIYFAVRGELSPVVAAILMPLSSISIVLYSTVVSTISARKIKT